MDDYDEAMRRVKETTEAVAHEADDWRVDLERAKDDPIPATRVEDVIRTVVDHLYVSTACQHTKHGECRKVCKFCPSECLCPCHRR